VSTLGSSRINLGSLSSVQLLNSTAGTYIGLPAPTQDAAGLHVTLPSASAPFSALAYVLKLTFSGQIPFLQPLTGAVVYQDVNYSGSSAVLTIGNYTADQLALAGLPNLSLSSLRLAPGYQIIGYSGDNYTGTVWTFTADNADLRTTGNNDAVASMKVQFNPATWFRITNVTDGLVLDSGGNVASGSALKQWTWNGSTNLQWQAVELGNGYYKLVNRTNGMVVDGGGATSNGAAAIEAPWNGGTNQQWRIAHQGDGRYNIINRTTGLVLDGGGAVPSGSPTKQWPGNGSTNLRWTFTVV
jgi:alpha-L-fucosidase